MNTDVINRGRHVRRHRRHGVPKTAYVVATAAVIVGGVGGAWGGRRVAEEIHQWRAEHRMQRAAAASSAAADANALPSPTERIP